MDEKTTDDFLAEEGIGQFEMDIQNAVDKSQLIACVSRFGRGDPAFRNLWMMFFVRLFDHKVPIELCDKALDLYEVRLWRTMANFIDSSPNKSQWGAVKMKDSRNVVFPKSRIMINVYGKDMVESYYANKGNR